MSINCKLGMHQIQNVTK